MHGESVLVLLEGGGAVMVQQLPEEQLEDF
jgi:hypothetical protein